MSKSNDKSTDDPAMETYDNGDDHHDAAGAQPQQQQQHAAAGTASGALFPSRLYRMLEEEEMLGNTDILSWAPNGRSFKVHNRERFENELMPRHFGSSKFRTFQKNLNLWGFHTVVAAISNPHRGEISNVNFIRGYPERCKNMKRVVKSRARKEEQVELYYESLKKRAAATAAAAAAGGRTDHTNIHNSLLLANSNGGINLEMLPEEQSANVKMPAAMKKPVSSPRQVKSSSRGTKRSSSSSSNLHDADSPLVKHIRLGDFNIGGQVATTTTTGPAASTSAFDGRNIHSLLSTASSASAAAAAAAGRSDHLKPPPPPVASETALSSMLGQDAVKACLLELLSGASNEPQQQQQQSSTNTSNGSSAVASLLREQADRLQSTSARHDALLHHLQALIGQPSEDNTNTTMQQTTDAVATANAENALMDQVHRLLAGQQQQGDVQQPQQRRSSLLNSTSVSDAASNTEGALLLLDQVQRMLGQQQQQDATIQQQRIGPSMYDSPSTSIPVGAHHASSEPLLDQVQRLLAGQQQQDAIQPLQRLSTYNSNNAPSVSNNVTTGSGANNTAADGLLDQLQRLIGHQQDASATQAQQQLPSTTLHNDSVSSLLTGTSTGGTSNNPLLLDQLQRLIGQQEDAMQDRRPSLYNTNSVSNLPGNNAAAAATSSSSANSMSEALVDQIQKLLGQPRDHSSSVPGSSSLAAAAAVGEGISDPLTAALLGQLGQQSQRPPVQPQTTTTSSGGGNDFTASLLDRLGERGLPSGIQSYGNDVLSSLFSNPSSSSLPVVSSSAAAAPVPATLTAREEEQQNSSSTMISSILDQLDPSGTHQKSSGLTNTQTTTILDELGRQIQDEQQRILQDISSRRRQSNMELRGMPSTVDTNRLSSSSAAVARKPSPTAAPNTGAIADFDGNQFDLGRLHGQEITAAATAALLRREQPQQEPSGSIHQTATKSTERRGDCSRRPFYLNDATGNRSVQVGARISEQDSSSPPPSLSNGGTTSNTDSGTGSGSGGEAESGSGSGSSGEAESGSGSGSGGEAESGSGSGGEAESGSGSGGEAEPEARQGDTSSRSNWNARRLEQSQSSSSPESLSNSGSNSNTESESGSGGESSRRGGDTSSRSYLNDPSSVRARRLEQSQLSSSPESLSNSGTSSNTESTSSGEEDSSDRCRPASK